MSASLPPLVGREAELAVLERALDEAGAGRSRTVGITGEPGIGKSRLLDEVGRRARTRGHVVMSGRASELEGDVPFALWVDALDDVVADSPEVLADVGGEQLAELAVVVPAVARLAGVAPAVTGERHRAARAVRALFEHLGESCPLVVLLDDVHWADPASAEVVSLLLHRLPRGRVLLVLAARARRAPAFEGSLHAAARRGEGDVVVLEGLPRAAVDALLGPEVGTPARAVLFRESRGNPFYLQALASARPPATGVPAGPGAPGVPRAVVAALAAEVAVLPIRARNLVWGAAVAGDPFDVAIAAAAAGMGEDEALDALDAVLAADVVRATDEPWRFAFRHPLVRLAVYEAAGGGWRLAAHARAAELLAARGATAAERAHHVARAARAGDVAAAQLLAEAGEETARTAPATAAGWYGAALRLLPDGSEHGRRRLDLLRAQAAAHASAGQAVEARDVLRRALALLPPDAAAERVAVVAGLAEIQARWTQEEDDARRLAQAELVSVRDVEPGLSAALTLVLSAERAVHGDHAAAEALADEARAAARAAGDAAREAEAAAIAADAAHCRLRVDDPVALAGVDARIVEAAALVRAQPDERVAERMQMAFWLGVAHFFTGDFASARAVVERGIHVARASGQGLHAASFVGFRGWIDAERGRLDAAEADLEESLESAVLSGNVQVAYWAHIGLSRTALARGRVDDARAHAQAAWDGLGVIEYSQAGYAVPDARLAAGDVEGAREALDVFGWVNPGLWTFDRLKAVEIVVRVLLALGRPEEAEEWAGRAPAEAGGRRTGAFGAVIALARARARLARGEAGDAAGIALQGAAAGDRGDAPLWAGRCRTLAGEALVAAGHRDDARAVLRKAAAELEARGAWGYRDEALRVLRRLGERPRPARAAGRDDASALAALTAREREVALLVADGRTNAQIAARLHLSESTVEKHVSRVLAKLGESTRVGVVRRLTHV